MFADLSPEPNGRRRRHRQSLNAKALRSALRLVRVLIARTKFLLVVTSDLVDWTEDVSAVLEESSVVCSVLLIALGVIDVYVRRRRDSK